MKEEGENRKGDPAAPKQRKSERLWESMTLIKVGNLDVIQAVTGSFTDTGGGMMMGFGT